MERIVKAFWNSMAGFRDAFASEAAIRQEAIVLAIGAPLAFAVGSGLWQRVALVGSLILLLAIELLNTAIEKLCDHVTPDIDPQIRMIKDIGSAAVFCGLCTAGLVWAAALAERLGFL